jgi:glycosyltransferase involved in cell wall biosynthesis
MNNSIKSNTVFFTIVAKNYISYARTLCQSIAKYHPEAKIYIGLSDKTSDEINNEKESFEIIEASQLDLPNQNAFAFRYDVMEFSTAIKPYMLRWIFKNTTASKVVYLDPDILVISPLVKVLRLLDEGASAVLTPHFTERVDDKFLPSENTMLQVGAYNLGFIALSRHDEAHKLIDWWCDRLERGAIVDLANGLFTDQKWADLMPCLFADIAVLRDPGYNAAYWNLMHRTIVKRDGKWFSNNQPLSFFHFSGVDPKNASIFSKHQNRYMLKDIGDLKSLYEYYLDCLKLNGYFETVVMHYAFNYLIDGTKIHSSMRTYFNHFLDTNKFVVNPFSLTKSYFNELEPSVIGNSIITRFMIGLLEQKSELQKPFNLNDTVGQYSYANWFVENASSIYAVDSFFIESVSKQLVGHKSQNNYSVGFLTKSKKYIFRLGYHFYRKYPSMARRFVQYLPVELNMKLRDVARIEIYSPATQRNEELRTIRDTSKNVIQKKEPGVTIVGYTEGDFGVAENMRSVAKSLSRVEFAYDIYKITAALHSNTNNNYKYAEVELSTKSIQLYCVNADQLNNTIEKLGVDKTENTYRVGYWFWELSDFPKDWLHAFDLVDEVWAPSRFIFDTLNKVTTKPLKYMPVAVDFEFKSEYQRNYFSIPKTKFLFLVSFDFHSFSNRKNSEAVIEAFRLAFPNNKNVGLVIKTINGEKYTEKYTALLNLTSHDERISIINKALSRDEMYNLINVCDCYVSLHRAEGFGLGMAEAMLLGKVVIATAYSGNMDFTNKDNSCLVDFSLVDVPSEAYPYWENQKWAEPNVLQASKYMEKVYSDASYREKMGIKAKAYIQEHHSNLVIGKSFNERLNEIKVLMLAEKKWR